MNSHEDARHSHAPQVSVIIAVYNRFEWLEMALTALKYQTYKDFEVVIADDGSDEVTVAAIERFAAAAPFAIHHCWHPDSGWRKNVMLNKAVVAARGSYLVFLDGDCIPSARWLADHVALRRRGVVLTGRRMQLSHQLTATLTAADVDSRARLARLAWRALRGAFADGMRHKMRCVRLPRPSLLPLLRRDAGVLGCNFSIYKDDLLAVNGFDERYINPGTGEDTDLEYRLRAAGVAVRAYSHYMIVYHRNHRRLEVNSAENAALLAQNRAAGISYTPYGINRHS